MGQGMGGGFQELKACSDDEWQESRASRLTAASLPAIRVGLEEDPELWMAWQYHWMP